MVQDTSAKKELVDAEPKRRSLSVIAPCFNEEANIKTLVERTLTALEKKGIDAEIILVNDCSFDNTKKLAEEITKQNPRVRLVNHEFNLGIFEGWKSGLQASRADYVCFIDADLQNPPEEIVRLYQTLQTEMVDMVQGTRSSIGRIKDSRYTLSVGLNSILNLLFGMKARDNKSGFVLAPRDVLVDVLNFRFSYGYPHTFIHIAAHAKNYVVKEKETLFEERKGGKSFIPKLPLLTISHVLFDILKAVIEFRFINNESSDLELFLRKHKPLKEPPEYKGWRKLLLELYFFTTPLHKWMISSRIRKDFFALRRTQYLKADDIKELQLQKLKRLIRHAYNQVPLYREKLKGAGISPAEIRSIEDLEKLPLLSKQEVRENLYFDLFAENHNKSEMLKIATSGSTGEPFICYADRRQLEMRFATTMRAAEWTGWKFGDKQVRLWHQTIGMSFLQIIRERFDAFFMRRLFIPAYEMKDSNIKHLLEQVKRHEPVLIDGYAESFNFLAHYLKKNNIEAFSPRAIMSSAQVLPDQTRKIIEEKFNCEVYDKYGSREFSGIAYEDSGHDGHLIQAESYIVEILKNNRPAKPGETGEVVITDLNNFHVPLIRYRIGDLATAIDSNESSATGKGLPRIGRIQGRAQAIVVCKNGAWLPGTFFAHFFKDFDYAVRHYQIVQESFDELEVKIVPTSMYNDSIEEEIRFGLKEFIGSEMPIRFTLVDEIPLVRTGKRTAIISKLKLDFLELQEPAVELSAVKGEKDD